MMEKTLVILKPCTLQRGLVGEIINRFERKGLRLAGMKMVQLTDEVLSEHYAHLSSKPFFQRVKDAMMVCPVIVCCFEGVDAVQVVRTLTGPTNGRLAAPGTIRELPIPRSTLLMTLYAMMIRIPPEQIRR